MYILVYIHVFVFLTEQYDPSHYEKTHPHSTLQVPTTQLAQMSIDPKFVELTADVLEIFLSNKTLTAVLVRMSAQRRLLFFTLVIP